MAYVGDLLSYANLLMFKTELNKQRMQMQERKKERENERKKERMRHREGERKERQSITDKEDGRSQFNGKPADFKST